MALPLVVLLNFSSQAVFLRENLKRLIHFYESAFFVLFFEGLLKVVITVCCSARYAVLKSSAMQVRSAFYFYFWFSIPGG
jgi:hypothetical protein